MASEGEPHALTAAAGALMLIRKSKSDRKLSMKADISSAQLVAATDELSLLEACADDLRAAGRVANLVFAAGDALELRSVEFAEVSE